MFENCISCNKCLKDCEFLKKYGNPSDIHKMISNGDLEKRVAYECSLCGLCNAVCPKGIDIKSYFLNLRRDVFKSDSKMVLKKFKSLLSYEKNSGSDIFKFYHIPQNANKLFFLGCAFTGKPPAMVLNVYKYLESKVGAIGIAIDCCYKISHDLGNVDKFEKKMFEKINIFKNHGIVEIITVCPSCTRVLRNYTEIEVNTIYKYLSDKSSTFDQSVTLHDPCVLRGDSQTQDLVRGILSNNGITITSTKYNRDKTLCCGEGGGVRFYNRELSDSWKKKHMEYANNTIATYCYGCKSFLKNKKVDVHHILDILFNDFSKINFFTFWKNRWKLKRELKRLAK